MASTEHIAYIFVLTPSVWCWTAGGGWWSLVLWSVVVSAIQGHSAGSGEGGGTLAQKLAELCPPVSTQINVETGRKLK